MSKIIKAYDVRIYVEFDYDELVNNHQDAVERHGEDQFGISFAQGRKIELDSPNFYPTSLEVLSDAIDGDDYTFKTTLEEPNGQLSIVLTQEKRGIRL